MKRSHSRRDVLAAAAMIAAGSTGIARAAARAVPESFDVAIVGGGLSGLNAAMILQDLGLKVVVLEANSRAGGRCLTKDDWHLQPDLGGVQIGNAYARILDVVRRLEVKLGPGAHLNAPYSFVFGETLIPARQWAKSPLNLTVGAERAIPPHALGGFYVEQRTPFKTLDGWFAGSGPVRRLRGPVAGEAGGVPERRRRSSATRRGGGSRTCPCCA